MAASNTTIIDDNAMVMHSIPMTAMAAATTTTTNTTTTTPKSVTFRTQDQVHQFDEQLELFKYVDEEFFLVAHYLLEVVDFEDRTDNIIDHHHDDHSGIVFGKEDPLTFSEGGTDRRRHRDGRPGPGLLSRLCGCGLGVGNDADDDDGYGMQNESINEELHNNEIEHNQRNNDWRGYQLSTKLVSNFVSALNFRMENIQSKLDGDEEIGEEDALVAARTREVVRKVNTYGLPLMIPQHSSRCEWNVPSKFIALDTNNVVVSLLCVCVCGSCLFTFSTDSDLCLFDHRISPCSRIKSHSAEEVKIVDTFQYYLYITTSWMLMSMILSELMKMIVIWTINNK